MRCCACWSCCFRVQREEFDFVIGLLAVATMVLRVLVWWAQNEMRRMAGFAVILGIGNMLAVIATGTVAGPGGTVFYALHSTLP